MKNTKIKNTQKLSLALLILLLAAISAEAHPSTVSAEGNLIAWKIDDTLIWRFPQSHAAEVKRASEHFNKIYKKSFSLTALKVVKKNGHWALCLNNDVIYTAAPAHARGVPMETRDIALTWMSRMYDALGEMHAEPLGAKHKLKGKYDLSGKVSWYGGKFIGRKCANGEIYTEGHLIAAAKTLPFGTLVKLTVPSTGKSAVVRVADRFGEHKGRALDISQAAAGLLGIKRAGVANVRLEVIGKVGHVGGK